MSNDPCNLWFPHQLSQLVTDIRAKTDDPSAWADVGAKLDDVQRTVEDWANYRCPADTLHFQGTNTTNITTIVYPLFKTSSVDPNGYGYTGGSSISFDSGAVVSGGDGFLINESGLYYTQCVFEMTNMNVRRAADWTKIFLTRVDNFFDNAVLIIEHVNMSLDTSTSALRIRAAGVYPMPAGSVWGWKGTNTAGGGSGGHFDINLADCLVTKISCCATVPIGPH